MKKFPCPACVDSSAYYSSGFRGIIARVVHGQPRSFIQKCDTCKVYKSDEKAEKVLIKKLKLSPQDILIFEAHKFIWDVENKNNFDLLGYQFQYALDLLSGKYFDHNPPLLNDPKFKYIAIEALKGTYHV